LLDAAADDDLPSLPTLVLVCVWSPTATAAALGDAPPLLGVLCEVSTVWPSGVVCMVVCVVLLPSLVVRLKHEAGARPHVMWHADAMNACEHLPKAFCSAHV